MGMSIVRSKKAFTLIELLVVIAIISMLVSVLMPALTKAKQQGEAVVCLSNLRQMIIASGTYSFDNQDYYPPAYITDPDPFDMFAIQANWDFTNIKDWNTMEEEVKPGLLWQDNMAEKLHQCPSFKGTPNADQPYSGYNYNTSFIGHGSLETIKIPAKTTAVKHPSGCALFGDGQYYDGANKFMRSPFTHKGDQFSFRVAGTQGYRHSNRTNVGWCDGHASPQRELYTESDDIVGKGYIEDYNLANPNDKVGFLSPDNSAYDLK